MPEYKTEEGFNWDDLMRAFQRYRGEGESGRPEYEGDFFEALMELAPEAMEAGGGSLPEIPMGKGGPDYYGWANQVDPGMMGQLEDYVGAQRESVNRGKFDQYLEEMSQRNPGAGKTRLPGFGPNLGGSTAENASKVWQLFHPNGR